MSNYNKAAGNNWM